MSPEQEKGEIQSLTQTQQRRGSPRQVGLRLLPLPCPVLAHELHLSQHVPGLAPGAPNSTQSQRIQSVSQFPPSGEGVLGQGLRAKTWGVVMRLDPEKPGGGFPHSDYGGGDLQGSLIHPPLPGIVVGSSQAWQASLFFLTKVRGVTITPCVGKRSVPGWTLSDP